MKVKNICKSPLRIQGIDIGVGETAELDKISNLSAVLRKRLEIVKDKKKE